MGAAEHAGARTGRLGLPARSTMRRAHVKALPAMADGVGAGGAGHPGGPLALRQQGRRDLHGRHAGRDEARRRRAAARRQGRRQARRSTSPRTRSSSIARRSRTCPRAPSCTSSSAARAIASCGAARARPSGSIAQVRPNLVVEMTRPQGVRRGGVAAGAPAQQGQRARAGAGAWRPAAARLGAAHRSRHQARPRRHDRPGEPGRRARARCAARPCWSPAASTAACSTCSRRAGRRRACCCRDLLQGGRGGRRQSGGAALRLHAAPARRAQLAVAEGGGEGARARPCSTPAWPTSSMRWRGPNRAPGGVGQRPPAGAPCSTCGRPPTSPAGRCKAPSATCSPSIVSDITGTRGHRRRAGQPAQRRAPAGAGPAPDPGHPLGFPGRLSGAGGARPASACRCRAPGGGASGRPRRRPSMPAAPAIWRRAWSARWRSCSSSCR